MGRGAIAFLLTASCAAHAQQAGDTIVSGGWVHVYAIRTTGTVHTDLRPSLGGTLLGIPESFDSQGTSASVSGVDTLGLTLTRYLSDHWSLDFAGGIPAKVDVYGHGVVSPGGAFASLFSVDLGDPAVNPLGSARQWSPALIAMYHFAGLSARFQPFIGVGFSYTWFTQVRLNPAFEQQVKNGVGRQMAIAAGKPGPTSVSVDAGTTWAPVANVGMPWIFGEHWIVVGSLGVAPFRTRTEVRIHASDGTLLSSSQVHVGIDAMIGGLLLGYRF